MTDLPTLANDSGWLLIWNDIKDLGPSFWAFLTIFSLVYFKEQICGLFKAIINKITFKKTSLSYTKKDLLKHPIFRNLDYWLNTGIDAIKLKNNLHPEDEDYMENKEKMAKEVIHIIYENARESFKTFIDEIDIDNLDCDVACSYLMECLTKNNINQKRKFLERGIPAKFLNKFYMLSDITEKLVANSVKNLFTRGCDLSPATKMYFAFNTIDGYLNIIFNNLCETIGVINGDLKDEMFDGQPMCKSYHKILKPPHPTHTMIVKEKLDNLLREFNGSRAMVSKYFSKDGEHYHSAVYESTIIGVTSEIENVQMINDDHEKNITNIMAKSGNIAADISKFGANTIERFNTRGVKGILLAPIYNDGKIDGALSIDYISIEKFDKIIEDKDLDAKLKKYADELAPYIIYPQHYKF